MEIRDFAQVIARRWRALLTILLVSVAMSALFTWQSTPQYSSSARLFVATSETDAQDAYQNGLFATQRVQSYADIVPKSRSLAERVVESLGGEGDPASVSRQVSAKVVPDTVNLEITATDQNPVRARDLAQAYAEGLSDLVAALETPEGQTSPLIKAEIVDNAAVSSTAISPRPLRNLAIGVAVGLMLGVGIAVLRDFMDNTVTSAEDVAQMTTAPVLAQITSDPSAATLAPGAALSGTSHWAESFRVLRTNMQFVQVDRQQKVFVVSSSLPGEGKTTTAVNLAMTLALTNNRVALIECDLRRPLIAKRLGIDGAVGTTSVLIGKVSAHEAMQSVGDHGLQVLACGPIPPNPAELLQSRAMESMLAQLREEFDVVLLDAPPLLPVTDAALLAGQADGALLIVRHSKTTREQLKHAVERLEAVDAKVVGTVLNMVPPRRGGTSYSYSYAYTSSIPDDAPPAESKHSAERKPEDKAFQVEGRRH